MAKDKKTNVMRMLDKARIPYTSKSYAFDESDLSGVHAASVLGLAPDMVFKTIVTRGDRTGPVVFCLPVDRELDLKAAARVSGNKEVTMVHVKDLPALTGYIRGGCSPIGMKKAYPTYIDRSCEAHPLISISAGQRGLHVCLAPEDLIGFIHARKESLVRPE